MISTVTKILLSKPVDTYLFSCNSASNRTSTQLTILCSWLLGSCLHQIFLLPLGCLSPDILLVIHPLPLSKCGSTIGLSSQPSPLYTFPGWFHPSHGFTQCVNAEESWSWWLLWFSHSYTQLLSWHLKFIVLNSFLLDFSILSKWHHYWARCSSQTLWDILSFSSLNPTSSPHIPPISKSHQFSRYIFNCST